MASPIDISFLSGFLRLFIAIFVFVFVFAILKKINVFGDGDKSPDSVYAVIALFMAIILMMSDSAYILISSTTPWFAVMFIFILLGTIPFMILGATEKDIGGVLKSKRWGVNLSSWIFVILIFIFVMGLVNVSEYNAENPVNNSVGVLDEQVVVKDTFWGNTMDIIRNKQVLGAILFLLIGYFMVTHLSRPITKD